MMSRYAYGPTPLTGVIAAIRLSKSFIETDDISGMILILLKKLLKL
jgi:hypothetical protein